MCRIEEDAVHRATYYNVSLKQMCWLNGRNYPKNESVTKGQNTPRRKTEEEESEGAASIALGFTCTVHEESIVSTLNAKSDEILKLDILH